MEHREITRGDIDAAHDVVTQLGEESDQMSLEAAARYRSDLLRLKKATDTAVSLLDSRIMGLVEDDARTVDGLTYKRGIKWSTKTDHSMVLGRATDRAYADAINKETGEIDVSQLLENVENIVVALYLAPSSTAKKTSLKWLGLEPADVETRTASGSKLLVIGDDQ